MNEKLTQALTELITKGTETVEKAGTFMIAEIPDVVRQLLIWHGVESFIWFCFGFISIIFGFILFKRLNVYIENTEFSWESNEDFFIFLKYALLISSCGIAFIFFIFNLTWLKIWIAPKIWLLEYASSLVK